MVKLTLGDFAPCEQQHFRTFDFVAARVMEILLSARSFRLPYQSLLLVFHYPVPSNLYVTSYLAFPSWVTDLVWREVCSLTVYSTIWYVKLILLSPNLC